MARQQATESDQAAQAVVTPAPRRRRRARRPGLLLALCTLVYALTLLCVSVANAAGPERWWLGSVNLFLPQWLWALPVALLLPWYLARAWRWSWVPLVLLAWVVGPLMGWSFGAAGFTSRENGTSLRIMTYNVKWGRRNPVALLANIAAADPDLILMQDSENVMDRVLRTLDKPGWSVVQLSQYTVLSRHRITGARLVRPTPEHNYQYVRCIVHLGTRQIALYDAHLITPRFALGALKENATEGQGDVRQNAALREQEADALAASIRTANVPSILAGDLNAPVQSRVCRTLYETGLRDAFSTAGWGYGYTYGQSTRLRYPFVRIDHIMVSPEWQVLQCREGGPGGSDHSPVIADLVLPDAPQGARQ